jgi:hypothetical protein
MKNLIPFTFLTLLFVFSESCQKSYLIDPIPESRCGNDVTTQYPLGDSLSTLYAINRKDYHNRMVFKDSLGRESLCELTKYTLSATLADFRQLCKDSTSQFGTTQRESLAWNDIRTDFLSPNFSFSCFIGTNIIGKGDTAVLYSTFAISSSVAPILSILIERNKPIKPIKIEPFYLNGNFVRDTTILGKNFKNLYFVINKKPRQSIFFEQKKGVVILQDSANTWLFDRFE